MTNRIQKYVEAPPNNIDVTVVTFILTSTNRTKNKPNGNSIYWLIYYMFLHTLLTRTHTRNVWTDDVL